MIPSMDTPMRQLRHILIIVMSLAFEMPGSALSAPRFAKENGIKVSMEGPLNSPGTGLILLHTINREASLDLLHISHPALAAPPVGDVDWDPRISMARVKSTLRELLERGASVRVIPHDDRIVMISNSRPEAGVVPLDLHQLPKMLFFTSSIQKELSETHNPYAYHAILSRFYYAVGDAAGESREVVVDPSLRPRELSAPRTSRLARLLHHFQRTDQIVSVHSGPPSGASRYTGYDYHGTIWQNLLITMINSKGNLEEGTYFASTYREALLHAMKWKSLFDSKPVVLEFELHRVIKMFGRGYSKYPVPLRGLTENCKQVLLQELKAYSWRLSRMDAQALYSRFIDVLAPSGFLGP